MNPNYNFTEDEQNDIIDEFLKFIEINEYKNTFTSEIKTCQCKCYKNHMNCKVLDKFSFDENMIQNIYSMTYECSTCKGKKSFIEDFNNMNKINNVNVIRWYFTRHWFPSIDVVRQVLKCGKERHHMFKNLYNNVTIKNDYKVELLNVIDKYNVYKTLVDFNKNINHIDNIQRGWLKTDYEPVITTQAYQERTW